MAGRPSKWKPRWLGFPVLFRRRRTPVEPTCRGNGFLQSCGMAVGHLLPNLVPLSRRFGLARQFVNRHRRMLIKIETLEVLASGRDRVDDHELCCRYATSSLAVIAEVYFGIGSDPPLLRCNERLSTLEISSMPFPMGFKGARASLITSTPLYFSQCSPRER